MACQVEIAISTKPKFFGTFCLFFLDYREYRSLAISIKIFKTIVLKMRSLINLICSQLQAKHLVNTQEKKTGIKMVLFYVLQQNISVELLII